MTATQDPRQLRLPHAHRWLVASPTPESAGQVAAVCRECGASRVFKVWLYDDNFNPASGGRRKHKGIVLPKD